MRRGSKKCVFIFPKFLTQKSLNGPRALPSLCVAVCPSKNLKLQNRNISSSHFKQINVLNTLVFQHGVATVEVCLAGVAVEHRDKPNISRINVFYKKKIYLAAFSDKGTQTWKKFNFPSGVFRSYLWSRHLEKTILFPQRIKHFSSGQPCLKFVGQESSSLGLQGRKKAFEQVLFASLKHLQEKNFEMQTKDRNSILMKEI